MRLRVQTLAWSLVLSSLLAAQLSVILVPQGISCPPKPGVVPAPQLRDVTSRQFHYPNQWVSTTPSYSQHRWKNKRSMILASTSTIYKGGYPSAHAMTTVIEAREVRAELHFVWIWFGAQQCLGKFTPSFEHKYHSWRYSEDHMEY